MTDNTINMLYCNKTVALRLTNEHTPGRKLNNSMVDKIATKRVNQTISDVKRMKIGTNTSSTSTSTSNQLSCDTRICKTMTTNLTLNSQTLTVSNDRNKPTTTARPMRAELYYEAKQQMVVPPPPTTALTYEHYHLLPNKRVQALSVSFKSTSGAHEHNQKLPTKQVLCNTKRYNNSNNNNNNMDRDTFERKGHKLLLTLISLVIVSVNLIAIGSHGQCLDKTMTSFERIGGVTIKDAPLTILYQANTSQTATIGQQHQHSNHHHQHHLSLNLTALQASTVPSSTARTTTATGLYQISTPITAECNNRCRRSKTCRAFLVDYSRHTCWSVDSGSGSGSSSSQQQQLGFGVSLLDRAPTPIQLAATGERTAYFEKVCLNLPIIECERAWIFERVLAHHIHGNDDKIIDDVPSRLKCQEHCLNERQFRCRSGEYDYLTMQCRLSAADRHTKQNLFRPTVANVDYFENQCVPPAGQQCDAFDRYEDMDLGRAEIMRLANSSEQCQQYCTQTIKAFICRSFTWSPLTGRCYLNSANTFMVGGTDKLLQAPGLVYNQRTDCVDLRLECDTSSMTLNLRTNEPFRGRMYVRDDPHACETQGRSGLMSSLNIPFQATPMGARCATRELPSRYSSVVVVQQHPLIQRKSDRYIKLVCDFQTSNKTITSHYNVLANPWTSTALINATSFAPKILLRITDKFGNDITGAKLGDELQLRIEADSESVYDMVARSVLAKSGTTDESIVLIDRDGCPADSRIFPPLKKINKRTIIGRFDAFKFSSDVVVRFQVDVQFCLNSCPPTNCLDPANQLAATGATAASLFNVNTQQLIGGGGGGGGQSHLQSPVASSSGGNGAAPAESTASGLQGDNLQPFSSSSPTTTATSSSTTTTTTTTSTPTTLLLNGSGSGDSSLVAPSEYLRPTNHPAHQGINRQQQQQADSLMNDYQAQEMPSRAGPPVNQPLNSNGNSNSNGYGLPTSDQLFDSAQPRDSSAKLVSLNGVHHHHQHHQHSTKSVQQNGNHLKHSKQPLRPIYDAATSSIGGGGGASSTIDGAGPQLSGPELAAALNQEQQQSDQNSHKSKRRRRRSTEPMPTAPKHVPLQREIIVIESPSGGGGGDGQANKQQQVVSDSSGGAQLQKKAKKSSQMFGGGGASGARGQRDMKSGSKPLGNGHRPQHDEDSSKYDLNQVEQLESKFSSSSSSSNNNNDNIYIDSDDTKTLACTNWTSLVVAILAFGALQMLTICICLVSWHYKRRQTSDSGANDCGRSMKQHQHQQQQLCQIGTKATMNFNECNRQQQQQQQNFSNIGQQRFY